MPERLLRRRIPSSSAGHRRKTRPSHPSPSLRRTPPPPRLRPGNKPSKSTKLLKRCSSDPMLWRGGGGGGEEDQKQKGSSIWSEGECGFGALYRPHTCLDVFAASSSSSPGSPSFMAFSPHTTTLDGYNKDAKVVVNVTVEGSPGPVKTMVKLGSSVEDTINLVVGKYREEGRTPKLDKDASSSYELHHSYFSLQSLDKSELIGGVGSRSFFLRRNGSNRSGNSSPLTSETIPAQTDSPPPVPPPEFMIPTFIARKIGKIVRRTRKLWKVLVCWGS